MSDIFKLFDGSMGAGGAATVTDQNASSFSDVESENDVVATLASGTDSVDLLVDYSDFANFVTFNSAESYVTLTADSVLNSYPVGGTVDDAQLFLNSLDGYQRFFLANWPAWSGHLRLNPAVSSSYVRVDDVGEQDGSARSSFLSPGTGSLSIQGWVHMPALTGANDAQVVFQKLRQGSTDGVTVYASGSSVHFRVVSGSTDQTVSASLAAMPSFFAAVLDRTGVTGTMAVYAGTTASFPTLRDSSPLTLGPRFDLASGSFFMGSGSVSGKVVRPFTGSLDSISVWSVPRSLGGMTGSYNRKVYAQGGLLGSWQFNDASPSTPRAYSSIVRDRSGHRLDGRIQNFFSASLGSGSFVNDVPDPILSLDDPNVVSYIIRAQSSASLYDRDNQSIIFNMFPEAFTQTDPVSAEVFSNFALVLARHFDRIKLYVNQLPNLRRVSYGDFDQSPDELLDEVGRYFGWDLQGSFATTDALRYFVGRNVRIGPDANASLDSRLSQIKSEMWRRVLLNLVYLYKTKGTAESVEALLRSYGVDAGFVRLKEYARKTESQFPTEPVIADKSAYALTFMNGSVLSGTVSLASGQDNSLEFRIRFPGTDTDSLVASELSGALLTLTNGASASSYVSLWYEKPSVGSTTGNLYVTSSNGRLQLTSASLFDERFYNLSIVREHATGTLTLRASHHNDSELVFLTSSVAFSGSAGYPLESTYSRVELGNSAFLHSSGQFWGQEFRLWNARLNESELLAHSRNYESYGRDTSFNNADLAIHWRLNDGTVASSSGTVLVPGSITNGVPGIGAGFVADSNPFTKFLFDYAYIPSIDYGWNQQKVRVFDGSRIDPLDAYHDERFVSLEFNMYDALNEDISHVITSYDELASFIGLPVNRYREDYEGLRQMRETYFKRLQGPLNFRVFVDMLDFFDSTFVKVVEKLLPARTAFKGDELIIESHMLERPKYQYQLRPVHEGRIEISGSISVVDRGDDFD